MLNQPQVADKRIWIESQRGPLPAATCRCLPLLEPAGYTVIGISGTGSKRLMRKEKALSPRLFLSLTYLSLPLPPLSPHESPGGTAILRTQALCVKGSYLFQL